MRNNVFLLLCSFVCFTNGCSPDIYEIARKSREFESITPINNIIEHYSRCYYCLPSNKHSIIDFLDNWRIEDSSTFCVQKEIYNSLKEEHFLMAAFKDSVFIYFPSQKIGTCVIGHPIYWIEHPYLYPDERIDYWWNFQTAAYRKDGRYCFSFDYSTLDDKIKQLRHKYENELFLKNSDICKSKINTCSFTIYKAIAGYDVSNDSLFIISPILESDKVYLFRKDKQDYCSLLETTNSLDTICKYYFDDLKTIFKLMSNDNISNYIFLLTLRY